MYERFFFWLPFQFLCTWFWFCLRVEENTADNLTIFGGAEGRWVFESRLDVESTGIRPALPRTLQRVLPSCHEYKSVGGEEDRRAEY